MHSPAATSLHEQVAERAVPTVGGVRCEHHLLITGELDLRLRGGQVRDDHSPRFRRRAGDDDNLGKGLDESIAAVKGHTIIGHRHAVP